MATSNVELPDSISYRQFDHWVTTGYIEASNPGSGYARQIEPTEQLVLNLMARLTEAGIPAKLAARVAREAVAENTRDACIRIGTGLRISIVGVRL